MTVAALTGNPSSLCFSGRTAAVASYGRALSGLRIALSVSCKRAAPFREAALVRCCSAAPSKASKQQPTQVRLSALLLLSLHWNPKYQNIQQDALAGQEFRGGNWYRNSRPAQDTHQGLLQLQELVWGRTQHTCVSCMPGPPGMPLLSLTTFYTSLHGDRGLSCSDLLVTRQLAKIHCMCALCRVLYLC